MQEQGASKCKCNHVGDVPSGDRLKGVAPCQHGGFLGHGRCLVGDCKCLCFTWAGYLPGAVVGETKRKRRRRKGLKKVSFK